MKMTLSSSPGNNFNNDNKSSDNKSISPSSSPRTSPRPSPRPQTKRDHSNKTIEHLTVNYNKEQQNKDGSPSSDDLELEGALIVDNKSQEGSLSSRVSSSSNIDIGSDQQTTPPITQQQQQQQTFPIPTPTLKLDTTCTRSNNQRVKKKSSWFNSFYPTYKSRSEDFKRIFKEVPDDERLVIDYSCALQREILVQGRLYVTQNYLCFYANIFGWETNVTIKLRDVSSITKEKTALVIPNAVAVCTKTEKFFFTSFVARDKTYLTLFRVWQNALMDQHMSAQELWHWVRQSYGDELGLTSDDEDYIPPSAEEDKLSARLSVDSFSEECASAVDITESTSTTMADTSNRDDESTMPVPIMAHKKTFSSSRIPTDLSDNSSESDGEKSPSNSRSRYLSSPSILFPNDAADLQLPELQINGYKCDVSIQCTAAHDGRQLMNEILPIHIDQLFTLLFTSSKFYLDFHASRKTTDLTQTPWTHNSTNNSKSRVVSLTVALNQAMGPKTAQVTETQVMLPCSKAGQLYSIDVDTVHAGVPYADSFNIVVHYCLKKLTENESSLSVYAQIKYKKSVWGFVKSMIEKNVWSGLEDFYKTLTATLHMEEDEIIPDIKRKSRRKKRIHSVPRAGFDDSRCSTTVIGANGGRIKLISGNSSGGIFSSDVATIIVFSVLLLLVILNIMLYYKLWTLEDTPPYKLLDIHLLKDPPQSHDEWINLLQQQETLHTVEIQKWQRILKTAIQLLKQTEESLNELQLSINPAYANKIASVLQNHQDNVENNNNGKEL